jgi:hypothetical protein
MKYVAAFVGCLVPFFAAGAPAICGQSQPKLLLRSQREAGQIDRVSVLLEFSGDFIGPAGEKQPSTPTSGTDRLTYCEKTLQAGPNRSGSVRYYEKAESDTRIKDRSHQQSLADAHRLLGVRAEPPAMTVFSLRQPLTRDELEVIDILGNTLLLDRLLPEEAVAVGDQWKPAGEVMAALLGLDGASRCDVQCTLQEVTPRVARFELAGAVEGPVSDTSARIELKGRYRLDRRSRRIDWFALVTTERREISDVAEGFRLAARLQVVISPLAGSPELTDEKLAGLSLEPTPERSKLSYQSPQGHWRIGYDRRWYPTGETANSATLKLIDHQSLGGQCNIFSLPQRAQGKRLGLEEFQADVKKVLGDDFGEFVEADQPADKLGRRVLRVVAQGAAHGKPGQDAASTVPIRWIYYHISDSQGRQVAMTFAVEQRLVARFADADKPIVESLRFE